MGRGMAFRVLEQDVLNAGQVVHHQRLAPHLLLRQARSRSNSGHRDGRLIGQTTPPLGSVVFFPTSHAPEGFQGVTPIAVCSIPTLSLSCGAVFGDAACLGHSVVEATCTCKFFCAQFFPWSLLCSGDSRVFHGTIESTLHDAQASAPMSANAAACASQLSITSSPVVGQCLVSAVWQARVQWPNFDNGSWAQICRSRT